MSKFLKYILFLLLAFSIYSSQNRLDIETDEATIDFQSEEFTAGGGVSFIYPNSDPEKTAKIKAYKLKKVNDKNLVIASDRVIFEQGGNKLEAQDIYFNLDNQSIIVRDGISYVVVDGAPELNNKIYYGGEEFMAKFPEEALVKNAWFTTSKKALDMKDFSQEPKDVLPYHMKAKKIAIYPEDKIVAYNVVLYAGKVPILWLPWYASSLKSDSKAPLFPVIGSNGTEGNYILWGIDYGKNSNYFNGSIALKNTEKKGLYLGQWDNVYKIKGDDKNKGKLSLTDALVLPKGDYETEYKLEHSHNYRGKYGSLDWKYTNQTINTINKVREQLESYQSGLIDSTSLSFTGVEQKLSRYELGTNLAGLGKNKDMSLKADIQYIDNKAFLQSLLGEINKNQAKDIENDNDIKSNVDFRKDNFLYGFNMKYEYLDDIDPGSQKADTISFTEGLGAGINIKKYGINLTLEEKDWDLWESLEDTERYNGGKYLNEVEGWAKNFSYVPFTVKKYDLYKNEKRLDLGSYSLFNGKLNYSINLFEKEEAKKLNRLYDPFRKNIDGLSDRDKEYHRDINILSEDTESRYAKLNLSQGNFTMGLELGNEKEEYVDRTRDDAGINYVNNSNYNDIQIRNKKIDLKKFGISDLTLGRRFDEFQRGDQLSKYYTNITNKISLYDNSGNYLRAVDLSVNNNASFYFDTYDFDKKNYDFNSPDGITNVTSEEDLRTYRLGSRQDTIELKNNLNLNLGNTGTNYGFNIKKAYNSFDRDWLQNNKIENSIDFKVDDKRTAYVSYGINEVNQKNDKDVNSLNSSNSNSEVKNIYGEKYFMEQRTDTVTLTLADDVKDFTFSLSDYDKFNREKYTRYKDGSGNYLNLSEVTTTYGNLKTIDDTKDNTFTFGYKLNEKENYKVSFGLGESSVYNTQTLDYNSKGDRIKLGFEWNTKDLSNLKINFDDYKDEKKSINDEKRLTLRYDYKKSSLPKSGNEKTVELIDSTGEQRLNLTEEELIALDKEYREEKRKEKGLGFDIMGLGEEEQEVIYKEYYSLYIDGIRNEDYFNKSKDLMESLESLQIKGEAHYKRLKLNYDYNLKANYTESTSIISRVLDTKTHELGALTMIGKSNESWKLKGTVRINENTKGVNESLDKWSVSVGKEFEFMSATVEYQEEWNTTYKIYDWVWQIKLALLTFPDKGLDFGTSYKKGSTNTEIQTGI